MLILLKKLYPSIAKSRDFDLRSSPFVRQFGNIF